MCQGADTGCTWFVNLARLRKGRLGDWHVTHASLQHINCTSRPKPSSRQLSAHPVVGSTLAADPSSGAQALITQLHHHAGVTASASTIYRAEESAIAEMVSEDPATIQGLPSFLREFMVINPGTFTACENYNTGHFRRAILILNPEWFVNGQRVFGIDAAHMKHRKYNGVKIILVGRDGNFSNQVAAVALAHVEDYDNYSWFFGAVTSHGFPLDSSPTFSDRNHGLTSAAARHRVLNMHCVRHIIGTLIYIYGNPIGLTSVQLHRKHEG